MFIFMQVAVRVWVPAAAAAAHKAVLFHWLVPLALADGSSTQGSQGEASQ